MSNSRARIFGHRVILPLLVLPGLVLAGCAPAPAPPNTMTSSPVPTETSSTPAPSATPEPSSNTAPLATPRPEPSATSEPPPQQSRAEETLAAMDLKERIGQVLMVGVPATGSSAADRSTIAAHKLGNFFLKGRSSAGPRRRCASVRQAGAGSWPGPGSTSTSPRWRTPSRLLPSLRRMHPSATGSANTGTTRQRSRGPRGPSRQAC